MGRDKAFVNFERQTLLEPMLDLARVVTLDVRIAGSAENFASFSPVVEDVFRDCGPLGGIHAALRAWQTDVNLMLAVDMPFVSANFLQYLVSLGRSAPGAVAVVPRSDGRRRPLCAIYRREFAGGAEPGLLAGRNRIDSLFAAMEVRVIEEEEWKSGGFSPDMFQNLNTPQELEDGKRNA